MKPTYKHTEHGTTICTLRDKNNNIVHGYAFCHPDENYSERVGDYIATMRAEIKYYKLINRIELKPQIKALRHLLSCYKNTGSKIYNINSPEIKLIENQVKMMVDDYEAVKDLIKELEKALKEYLKNRNNLIGQDKIIN